MHARRTKDLRWLDLPYREAVVRSILDYAASVRGRFENVCVLGIGGSALGITALQTALNGPFHNLQPPKGVPRLFVLDNIDPEWIGPFLETLDPSRTVFDVISKSGTTAETMSQFLILRAELVRRLGERGHREHVLITTDESKGVLRAVVEREGYRSFTVPEGVGGRFSVLSEVGLVSSALVGVDIEALLAGAAATDTRCKTRKFAENPALLHAAIQFALHTKHALPLSVTFAYSHRLRDVSDWTRGSWRSRSASARARARSAGAVRPRSRAVGVTDQHSQVQLYRGPFDRGSRCSRSRNPRSMCRSRAPTISRRSRTSGPHARRALPRRARGPSR